MEMNRGGIVRIALTGLMAVIGLPCLIGFSQSQVSVPDIEARAKALFDGFKELEKLGAYVVGSDGKMLGTIATTGSDALGNEYGAGSQYRTDGLFNTYSQYGSPYSSKSAFNDMASSPPEILVKKDGTTYSIGLLTTNTLARTTGQRISPHLLRAYFESK
jgi:hypothetical protein